MILFSLKLLLTYLANNSFFSLSTSNYFYFCYYQKNLVYISFRPFLYQWMKYKVKYLLNNCRKYEHYIAQKKYWIISLTIKNKPTTLYVSCDLRRRCWKCAPIHCNPNWIVVLTRQKCSIPKCISREFIHPFFVYYTFNLCLCLCRLWDVIKRFLRI